MTASRALPPLTARDHVQGGDAAALVTLVEYGDFECPYCGAAYPILKRVKQRLGERLRFVFRNFPLAEIHPHAAHAAEASESVAERGGPAAYWAMHDLIFEHQRALDDASLARYAAEAGVDPAGVLQDLQEERYAAQVRTSFIGGVRSGVNGTPTLFIDGIRYDGPRDEETLVAALELVAGQAAALR
ncbi:MAG TPA: thioredoxin domain-containing protein, partial [Gemmatimonadales bacterium]|nr:thioredoxin domain-containing protein [Gemmatimonadales bacterium]